MYSIENKSEESRAIRNNSEKHVPTAQFKDNRSLSIVEVGGNTAQLEKKENLTGMPDNLKEGIESLSGFSMDDVRVHYNSSKPATVQALAYTQGTDIHVAPGQEKHLPHEAWHVAQQMAGRVSPTTNINGMPVNDNVELEREADLMGEKAVQCKKSSHASENSSSSFNLMMGKSIQRNPDYDDVEVIDSDFSTSNLDAIDRLFYSVIKGYGIEHTEIIDQIDQIHRIINSNPNLKKWYEDAARQLSISKIKGVDRQKLRHGFAQTGYNLQTNQAKIKYDKHPDDDVTPDMLCVLVLHELMHVDSAVKYNAYSRNRQVENGLFIQSHNDSYDGPNIIDTDARCMIENGNRLKALWNSESSLCNDTHKKWIGDRIDYMMPTPDMEYDTVLGDLVYYMVSQKLTHLKTYRYANKLLAEANERRNTPGKAARVVKPKNHFWQIWR